jgi:hypothetical protein
MPQIYYGDDILRETTSTDQKDGSPPIGSLNFYKGSNGTPFGWANGNPLELAPTSGSTIFHCYNSKLSGEFLDPPADTTCLRTIWVISAIG